MMDKQTLAKNAEKAARRAVKRHAQKIRKRLAKRWFVEGKVDEASVPGLGNIKGFKLGGGSQKVAGLATKSLLYGGNENFVQGTQGNARCTNVREFLYEYVYHGSEAVGDTLVSIQLNPSVIPVPRLNQFANLYQKYCIRKLKVHIQALNAATESGGYLGYISYDPQEPMPLPGITGVRSALAHKTKVVANSWTNAELDYIPTGNVLFVQPDPDDARLSDPGFCQVLNMAGGVAGATLLVEFDYDIEFFDAVIAAPSGPVGNTSYSRGIASTGITGSVVFGTDLNFTTDFIGVSYSAASNALKWFTTLPGQGFLLALDWAGTDPGDPSTYSTTTSTNLTFNYVAAGSNANLNTTSMIMYCSSTTAGECVLKLLFPSFFATCTRAEVFITTYNTLARPLATKTRVLELENKIQDMSLQLQEFAALVKTNKANPCVVTRRWQ